MQLPEEVPLVIDSIALLATAAASAAGTLVAGAIGYRYAIARFRRERTFDKQLLWYEQSTARLLSAANRINWAQAADLANTAPAVRAKAWAEAQEGLVSLRGLEAEAEMYASQASHDAVAQALNDISSVSTALLHVDAGTNSVVNVSALYEVIRKLLYHAASRLATDGRTHLGLPEIGREWRLYDEEIRALQEEVAELTRGKQGTCSPSEAA